MKIHSGLFSVCLFILPLIIYPFNSYMNVKGAVMLIVAMKLCSAQLRHQNGAVTARPLTARLTCTGTWKAWNVFTQASSVCPLE